MEYRLCSWMHASFLPVLIATISYSKGESFSSVRKALTFSHLNPILESHRDRVQGHHPGSTPGGQIPAVVPIAGEGEVTGLNTFLILWQEGWWQNPHPVSRPSEANAKERYPLRRGQEWTLLFFLSFLLGRMNSCWVASSGSSVGLRLGNRELYYHGGAWNSSHQDFLMEVDEAPEAACKRGWE